MDYKEKLNDAVSQLQAAENAIYTQEANAIRMLKEILTPCGAHGCLVGTDDYADDIFYPWAEPTPGAFRRITAVRYLPGNDALEDVYVDATSPEEAIEKAEAVFNEGHDGWIDWEDIDCPEYDEARGVEEQK